MMPTEAELRLFLRWRETGIPQRLWEKDIAGRAHSADSSASYADVCRWFDELPVRQRAVGGVVQDEDGFGKGLLLCGPPGTGKTTAAAAALTSIRLHYGKTVYFARWPEYLRCRQILSTAREIPDADHWYGMHDMVSSAFAVVLDDVGHEHSSGSGFGERLLDEVLRHRYDAGLPTLLTTNLESDEWAARYDPTLRSFIYQACPPLIFGGPDRRVMADRVNPRAE